MQFARLAMFPHLSRRGLDDGSSMWLTMSMLALKINRLSLRLTLVFPGDNTANFAGFDQAGNYNVT